MPQPGQKPTRVLIVGWGFIGSALGHRLAGAGVEVTALTRSHTARTGSAGAAGIQVVIGDAGARGLVEELVAQADHVVYAVGGPSPVSSALDPALDATSTLLPLISVLEELRRSPRARLTYLSSGGTVYGDPASLPVRETDPLRPLSPYGVSRAAAEMYVQMYADAFGIPVQVARCANVYGPGQSPDGDQGVVAIFLDRVGRGAPVVISGDGSAIRDYVFIDDVAAVLEQFILTPSALGVLNVGSGEGRSVIEVLRAVERALGKTATVEFRPQPLHQVRAVVLDITRLSSQLAYTSTPFEEGLRRTAETLGMPAGASTGLSMSPNVLTDKR